MLVEGVGSLNLNSTTWKYILTEDTDIDQDGDVSDDEIEKMFESYMEDLFNMMDQNKDKALTEQEVQSIRVHLPGLNKVIDAVFDNYPVKTMFFAADAYRQTGNRDGILDDSDFYLPGIYHSF